MRTTALAAGFVLVLAIATPSQAQLRQDARAFAAQSTPRLYSAGDGFSLQSLFSPQHFKMAQSYELSAGSVGGSAYSLGLYTNSLMWQFSQKLAARVDLSVAHSPFGNSNRFAQSLAGQDGQQPFRFFVQNAEVAYRPSENMELRFSYRQSPYGAFYSPYGYNPYARGMGMGYHTAPGNDLFWRDAR